MRQKEDVQQGTPAPMAIVARFLEVKAQDLA
jgi:hypothetical protein